MSQSFGVEGELEKGGGQQDSKLSLYSAVVFLSAYLHWGLHPRFNVVGARIEIRRHV